MADAIAEAMQGDFVTKTDLKSESQGVRAELREIELRLKAKIEAMKADLIEWVVGMIGFQTLVLLGAALALDRAVAK